MAIDVKVIKVKRSDSRHGKPMWILNTAGGDSIYIFDNMLEEMAQAMGAAFPDAHDAAADVKMTIAVLRWAYAEAHKRART